MYKLLLLPLTLFSLECFCQDSATQVRKIDSLVESINHSNFIVQHDSTNNDVPAYGIFSKTYITVVLNGQDVVKYVNNVTGSREVKNKTVKMTTSNTFYYHHNKLIKVEDQVFQDNMQICFEWYYDNDKSLYYTMKTDRSAERAELLLVMSKAIMTQFAKPKQ